MKNTTIEWADRTFNPWWGCQRVSPGCENCYAEAIDTRFNVRTGTHWGPGAPRREMSDMYWRSPLLWDRMAERRGRRDRVFCASMCDVFEEGELQGRLRQRLWALIRDTPHLIWMLLTKRPENFSMLPWEWQGRVRAEPYPNVWLGVTAEDQKRADERIPLLLQCPATIHFVSYEPALEAVDFSRYTRMLLYTHDGRILTNRDPGYQDEGGIWRYGIDWLICGAESGRGARPFDEDWARGACVQCQEEGVAFFYKQKVEGRKKVSLPELDGRQWAQVPILTDTSHVIRGSGRHVP